MHKAIIDDFSDEILSDIFKEIDRNCSKSNERIDLKMSVRLVVDKTKEKFKNVSDELSS